MIVQQGNNYVWWYTQKFHRIRFKTTERELNEVFDRYVIKKVKKTTIHEDIIVIADDNSTTGNDDDDDDDDDDVQWFKDPVVVPGVFATDQHLNKRHKGSSK